MDFVLLLSTLTALPLLYNILFVAQRIRIVFGGAINVGYLHLSRIW
jgi:hypothetical protein